MNLKQKSGFRVFINFFLALEVFLFRFFLFFESHFQSNYLHRMKKILFHKNTKLI